MKTIYKSMAGLCLLAGILTGCQDDDLRKVYPHSTPVIESAAITPSTFTYGDSVTFSAHVSDEKTPLSTIEMKMVINDVVVTTQTIRTPGNETDVTARFKVPYLSNLPDNATAEVQLTLINVEGDETTGTVAGVTGKRTYYNTLYLVLNNGTVLPLKPKTPQTDQYVSEEVFLTNSISYKIASKLKGENEIDYSGDVWILENNAIAVAEGESGGDITTIDASLRRITQVTFDTYQFKTTVSGVTTDPSGLYLSDFSDATISGEAFKKITRNLTEGQGLNLHEGLENTEVVFNVDYFNRIQADSVQFTGPTGSYDLYYSPSRKYLLVDPADKTFPNILFACGVGLGYPSKTKADATTGWGFDNILQCLYFKKIGTNIYQGTIYFDASQANFKFFESTGWANEKKSDDYTLPAIIESSGAQGKTDGNWYAAPGAASGNYRITINLSTKEVTAVPVTLP